MRTKSQKRAKREREAKPVREALRAEVSRCEICGKTGGRRDVHEISRGAHRQAALDKRFALLLVCRSCHNDLGSAESWPESRQLAILATRREIDFDLPAYLELTRPGAPRRIEMADIMKWIPHQEVASEYAD